MSYPQKRSPMYSLLKSFWDDEDFDLLPSIRGSRKDGVSLSEDEHSVYIEALLPGLNEKNIEVTLENGVLWIRGKEEQKEDKKKYHFRHEKSYSYQLSLPEVVDDQKEPKASYKNGVLEIVFKKKASSAPKKINIES